MREHMRADESVHVAKRQQEELARSALSSVELVAKGSFGYMGTASSPQISHHVPQVNTLLHQCPEVTAQFSGEHSYQEELRASPARRRRYGPQKPILSAKIWKCLNTPTVRSGEAFAKSMQARALEMEQAAMTQKMAVQMYERNTALFGMTERALSREMLENRAGQKRSKLLGSSYAQDLMPNLCQSLPASAHSSTHSRSRADVPPGDLLQSIERYSRNPGSLLHEKRSILPNGGLGRDGASEQVLPRFHVDEKQRETRRVVTGGTCDRLSYSDGSLLVVLPPKVLDANPVLAGKPLILRDGTQSLSVRITAYYKSTIRARTLPHTGSYCGNSTAVLQRKAVATAGELVMEVPRLSTAHTANTPYREQIPSMSSACSGGDVFNQKSSTSLLSTLSGSMFNKSLSSVSTENRIQMHPELGRMQTSMVYTTSLSPRSWQKLTASKSKLREKTDKLILRPDLDALAEYYALQKLQKEQVEVRKVLQRVIDHREHERGKLKERTLRRMALQEKAGIVISSEQEEYNMRSYMQENRLNDGPWSGSWTQKSSAGGSLTHKAPGDPAQLFGPVHRPR